MVEPGWNCSGQPSTCTPAGCGDGTITFPEDCDDNNTAPGDGCDANCTVESGWTCSGEPSDCDPICGDSIPLGGEECDDGNGVNDDICTNSCTNNDGKYGSPCLVSTDCAPNFDCLDEVTYGTPGGYCTKLSCNPNSNCVAGPGYCIDPFPPGAGAPACAEQCSSDANCRWVEGYSCQTVGSQDLCMPP
jgi:cysteine-rich repeat protein